MTLKLTKGLSGLFAAALIAISMPALASAASVEGEIAFFGTYEPVGGTDLASATGLSFPSPQLVMAGTGSFTDAVGTLANFSTFSFDPASPSGTLIFDTGDVSFTATSITVDFQTATALDLTIAGIYSVSEYDDSAGTLVLTADAMGGLYTFSATGVAPAAVPVPGALLLMGSALLGLGARRRRS